jgi:DNA-binding transcriptional LysR family regulator
VKEEGFIISSRTHPFQLYCNRLFRQAGVECRVIMECDYMMVGQFIEAGLGVALTTRSAYTSKAPLLQGNSVCIPLTDAKEPRSIALVWNPRRGLGKAAREFREFLLCHADKE